MATKKVVNEEVVAVNEAPAEVEVEEAKKKFQLPEPKTRVGRFVRNHIGAFVVGGVTAGVAALLAYKKGTDDALELLDIGEDEDLEDENIIDADPTSVEDEVTTA